MTFKLSALPNEILSQVFSLLNSRTLERSLMRVNRNFRIIAHDILSQRVTKAFKENGYYLVLEVSCNSLFANQLNFLYMEDSPRCHFSFASDHPPQYIFSVQKSNSAWVNLIRMHPVKTDRITKLYKVTEGEIDLENNNDNFSSSRMMLFQQQIGQPIELPIDNHGGSFGKIIVKFIETLKPGEFKVELEEVIVSVAEIFNALEEEEEELELGEIESSKNLDTDWRIHN
ncbi:11124_t:CDS:2 [Ambispora gerdemannii]|uniref:11124_t:CDS:1 n=1 Tax=Ambispora gerdemannii TaxID=144530 RepID=A0A9N9CCE0_9GLOM|nr:11124_t:CDS:2 [Ambispora gerdemannii]